MTISESQKPVVASKSAVPRRAGRVHRTPSHEPSASAIFTKKIFMLLLFMLAQVLFYYSDFFKLQEIRIQGNQRVSNDQILQAACIPMDQNIVTLPVQIFQSKISTIHWIRDVKVHWTLPGRINILVIEREPVVLVRQNGKPDQWFTSDNAGMILYQTGAEEKSEFPRLVLDEPVTIGKMIAESKVEATCTLDEQLPPPLRQRVTYYMVDDQDEVIILTTRMGQEFKIKVGKTQGIKRKLELLAAILELIDEKKIAVKYIDLRFNDPVILPVTDGRGATPVKKASGE